MRDRYSIDDDETPAGFRDADLEMAELTELGNRAARLKKRGICCHGWAQGQPGGKDGPVTCLECGATFPNSKAHYAARDQALGR